MNVRVKPMEDEVGSLLRQEGRKSLLRFVACGSVDHGKSTLIGRLLYETGQVFDDQLDALAADSRKFGTQGGELDFALLLDGLAAEREQNITIDVAYRFFATARRKFIVIDAPGHEQYTANMATGASLADVALVLVGADDGLTRQSRRHVAILAMIGLRKVVLAVNKMDRVGWSQSAFRSIETSFRAFARERGIDDVVAIPLAANSGDNVVRRSTRTDWYRGPTLLDYLEQVETTPARGPRPFRMPIQWVNRPNADFRGYSGLIASGNVFVGMPVRIMPSGRLSRIARIATYDGDLDRAGTGGAVTVTLTDQVDASRGDVLVSVDEPATMTDRIAARIFWMHGEPLRPGRNYLFKLATTTVTATLEAGAGVFDLDSAQVLAAPAIAQNEIGSGMLTLDRAIALDRYADCKETGSFILIDPETYDTVGMGCVEDAAPVRRVVEPAPQPAKALRSKLTRWTESRARSLAKAVSWRATGSLDTFVVAFVITRNPKIAGSVAVTEILTKILIYYFHERIWALVPWGKR